MTKNSTGRNTRPSPLDRAEDGDRDRLAVDVARGGAGARDRSLEGSLRAHGEERTPPVHGASSGDRGRPRAHNTRRRNDRLRSRADGVSRTSRSSALCSSRPHGPRFRLRRCDRWDAGSRQRALLGALWLGGDLDAHRVGKLAAEHMLGLAEAHRDRPVERLTRADRAAVADRDPALVEVAQHRGV